MSERERVEALALVMLRAYYDSPDETFEHHDREIYDDLACAVLDSPAMRDLLAEAKADAWDEGLHDGLYSRDAREPHPPNPYRETTTGADDA